MKLEKKVHAINETQRIAVLNHKHIVPILKEFIGKQMLLVSGNMPAKLKKAISFLDEQPKGFGDDYARLHRCYLDINNYSVWLKFSCCFKDDNVSCFYEDCNIYLGTIKNGLLENIDEEPPEFVTYKVGEVKALMIEKEQVEEQLSTLKSKLRKFDGYYS